MIKSAAEKPLLLTGERRENLASENSLPRLADIDHKETEALYLDIIHLIPEQPVRPDKTNPVQ